MSKVHRPNGNTLATWEADILKIRAYEMVVILFYLEDLRRIIMGSIETTDKLFGLNRLSHGKSKTKEGTKLELARAVLVSEGVINQAESDEFKELIDYRNIVGHTIHDLTVDVGAYSDLARSRDPKTFEPIPAYDYTAAKQAKVFSQKVHKGMMEKLIPTVSVHDT